MNIHYKKQVEEIPKEITKELQKNIQTINSDNTHINNFSIETEHDMINGITKFKYTVTYTTPNRPLNQENNKTGE